MMSGRTKKVFLPLKIVASLKVIQPFRSGGRLGMFLVMLKSPKIVLEVASGLGLEFQCLEAISHLRMQCLP